MAGKRINVVHPDFPDHGTVSILESDVEEATGKGWVPETPDIAEARYYRKKYGDRPVEAFGTGVVRTLTGGISDVLGEPESLRELRAQNVGASVGGEIVGAVVPFGAPAKAFQAGAAVERVVGGRLIREGAKGVERVGAKVITRAAGEATAGGIFGVGQGVSSAALSEDPVTAEGLFSAIGHHALYGIGIGGAFGAAGALVGELGAAYKNLRARFTAPAGDDLTSISRGPRTGDVEARKGFERDIAAREAEAVAARPTLRAEEAPAFVAQVESSLPKFRDEIRAIHKDSLAAGAMARKGAAVVPPGKTAPGMRGKGAGGAAAHDVALNKAVKDLDAIRAEWQAAFGAEIRPVTERVERFAAKARAKKQKYAYNVTLDDDALATAISNPYKNALHARHRQAILNVHRLRAPAREFSDLWPRFSDDVVMAARKAREAKNVVATAAAKLDDGAATRIASEIDDLKSALRAVPGDESISDFVTRAEGVLKMTDDELLAAVRQGGYESLEKLPGRGAGLDAIKAKVYEEVAKARIKSLRAPVGGRGAGIGGGVGGVVGGIAVDYMLDGALGGPVAAALGGGVLGAGLGRAARAVLRRGILRRAATPESVKAKLVGAAHEIKQRTSGGVDTFLKRPLRKVARAAVLSQASKLAFTDDPDARKPKGREAMKARVMELNALAASEERTARFVWDRLEGIRSLGDLRFYDQMSTIARKQIAFLHSKSPQPPPRGLIPKKWEPGEGEMHRFARYIVASANPVETLLEELQDGTLSAETIEAAKALAPATYERVKALIVARIPEVRETLPYQKRVLLSILFDAPVDASMAPERVIALQASFAMNEMERQESGGVSKSDIGSVKLKQEPTPGQRAAG